MDLRGDDRGVSVVLGAVLIFGVLVIMFMIYQVSIVPAQNRAVELQNYQDVREDMQNLRNAIISVGETNNLVGVQVRLGTHYPARAIGVNGPPPQGQLFTDTAGTGEVSVTGINETKVCGIGDQATSKSITYKPNYNYLTGVQPITYENTVLYRETADGRVLVESEQALIRDKTINLLPLVGNVSKTSGSSVGFDLQGDQTGEKKVSATPKLTIPTALSASTWQDLLADQSNVDTVTANGTQPSAVDVQLKTNTYTVKCTAVGAGEAANADVEAGGVNDEINPAAPGDIALVNETVGSGGDSHIVTLNLNNTGNQDIEIVDARINFYQDANSGGKVPDNADLQDSGGTTSASLAFRGTSPS
ncbi:hypothetical protein VB773_10295 [Haloarculaceae archaeon H-GB2-1]|nr:hypothetical protein [Haloarculaceae archaeon H-GB11]MEA5407909.1 hypothetical protein [Haloarculaceae archaeon H-GB2-1]